MRAEVEIDDAMYKDLDSMLEDVAEDLCLSPAASVLYFLIHKNRGYRPIRVVTANYVLAVCACSGP